MVKLIEEKRRETSSSPGDRRVRNLESSRSSNNGPSPPHPAAAAKPRRACFSNNLRDCTILIILCRLVYYLMTQVGRCTVFRNLSLNTEVVFPLY